MTAQPGEVPLNTGKPWRATPAESLWLGQPTGPVSITSSSGTISNRFAVVSDKGGDGDLELFGKNLFRNFPKAILLARDHEGGEAEKVAALDHVGRCANFDGKFGA